MPEPLRVESLRALDKLIAERVIGLRVAPNTPQRFVQMGDTLHPNHVPHYSETWSWAGVVVERMAEGGWRWTADDRPDAGEPFRFAWRFHRGTAIHRADSPTVPLAICLAALAAKGVPVELSLPEADHIAARNIAVLGRAATNRPDAAAVTASCNHALVDTERSGDE